MDNISFWEQDSFFDGIDVLIVGSGIVGLSAALRLRAYSQALNITVVDRSVLPSGASTKNAGFACFGSLSELIDDLQHHSQDQVLELLEKRWKGLKKLRILLGDKNIAYQNSGGYEVFSEEDTTTYEACLEQLDEFNQLLSSILGEDQVFSPADQQMDAQGLRGFKHLIVNKMEGQLHTGKMMAQLSRLAQQQNIRILSGLQIQRFEEKAKGIQVYTEDGIMLKTRSVLVCTNGFTHQLFPSLEVTPARNQVLITAPIPGLKLNGAFHYDKGYVYFRNVGNRILLGGGRNRFPRIETTDHFGLTDEIQSFLEDFLKTHLLPHQNIAIAKRWSGILGVGPQKRPIVMQYSDRIFTAVRLGGMGVAIGSLVGEEGADLVLEQF